MFDEKSIDKFLEKLEKLKLNYEFITNEIIESVEKYIDFDFKTDSKNKVDDNFILFASGDGAQRTIRSGPWRVQYLRSAVVASRDSKITNMQESSFDFLLPLSKVLHRGRIADYTLDQIRNIVKEIGEDHPFTFLADKKVEDIFSYEPKQISLDDFSFDSRDVLSFLESASFVKYLNSSTKCEREDCTYYFDGFIPKFAFDFFKKSDMKIEKEKSTIINDHYGYFLEKEGIFAGFVKTGDFLDQALWWYLSKCSHDPSFRGKTLFKLKSDKKNIKSLICFEYSKYARSSLYRQELQLEGVEDVFDYYLCFFGQGQTRPCLVQVLRNDYYEKNKESFVANLLGDSRSIPYLSIPAVINSAHNSCYFHSSEVLMIKNKITNYLTNNSHEILKLYKYEKGISEDNNKKTRFPKNNFQIKKGRGGGRAA